MQVSIYRLRDPRTNVTRYVGKTVRPISIRLSEHLCHSGRNMTKCAAWIRSLEKIGLKPQVSLIEKVNEDAWIEAEQHWIAFYRGSGNRLCNLTDGGEGLHGRVGTPEESERKRIFATGRIKSPETRRKISLAKLGKPRPDVALRNKRTAKLSEDQVAEIRSIGLSESGVFLAKKYGVSTALICCIRNNTRRN